MVIHSDPHPQMGETVILNARAVDHRGLVIAGQEFRVEDWADRLLSKSWMECAGNPAARQYAIRSAYGRMPIDNEVVYGHIGPLGHMVHQSELEEL